MDSDWTLKYLVNIKHPWMFQLRKSKISGPRHCEGNLYLSLILTIKGICLSIVEANYQISEFEVFFILSFSVMSQTCERNTEN